MLVTSATAAPGGDVVAQLERALAGIAPGTVLVQVREKQLGGRDLVALVSRVVAVAHARGARVVVNDRVDVALACGADGAHLPESGLAVAEARALLGAGGLLGASVHGEAGARARRDASYLVMGPVWDSPGKPASGLDALRDAVAAASGTPVFAVGGIDPERAALARGCGAWGVAVIRAVMAAADPATVTARLAAAVSR